MSSTNEQDQSMLDPIMERSMSQLSSNHGVNDNDADEALKLMKTRLRNNAKDTLSKIHLKAGDTYRSEEMKAADEAQEMVNWFTSQISSMMKKVESTKLRTININEIPKFQLKGQSIHFPENIRYSTVEHYFSAFENVVHASGNLIEDVRSQYIPISVPFEYESWVRNDLIRCQSWDQAKDLFRKHYGTPVNTEESLGKLFKMKMKNNDTLQDYTNQFITNLQNAGCSLKSTLLAKFYRFTLLRRNQQIMMNQMKVIHREGDYPWTVNRIYECVLPLFLVDKQAGDNLTYQAGGYRHRGKRKSIDKDDIRRTASGFYCARHGGGSNANHYTSECRSKLRKFRNENRPYRATAATTSPGASSGLASSGNGANNYTHFSSCFNFFKQRKTGFSSKMAIHFFKNSC